MEERFLSRTRVMRLYDALIIGAGPSGSVLARLLARGGWRVLAVDRDPTGSDRVCGGFLGPEVQPLWRELGVEPQLECLRAEPIRHLLFSGMSRARFSVPLPGEGSLAVSRDALSIWLREQAEREGAFLQAPASATRLRRSGSLFRATVASGNEKEEVSARVVIRAAGRRKPMPAASREGHFGCKTVYEGVSGFENSVALHFVRGGHVGFNRLSGGRTLLCLYVGQARLRDCRGRLDAMVERMAEENPAICELLSGARRAGPWLSCPAEPDGREVFLQEGCLHVGDAVTMLNPLLGGGMSVAMGSSVLLSRELLAKPACDIDVERVARRYASAWRSQYAGRVRFGRGLAWCEDRWQVSEAVLQGLSAFPSMVQRLVRYARPTLRVSAPGLAGGDPHR